MAKKPITPKTTDTVAEVQARRVANLVRFCNVDSLEELDDCEDLCEPLPRYAAVGLDSETRVTFITDDIAKLAEYIAANVEDGDFAVDLDTGEAIPFTVSVTFDSGTDSGAAPLPKEPIHKVVPTLGQLREAVSSLPDDTAIATADGLEVVLVWSPGDVELTITDRDREDEDDYGYDEDEEGAN